MRRISRSADKNKINFDSSDFSGVFLQYGISSDEFIYFVVELEKNFNFTIEPSLFNSKNPPGKIHIPYSYVSFVYYCRALWKEGIDVANLVRQFIAAKRTAEGGDLTEVRHVSSLARLGFILHRKGHTITFPNIENGDLNINGIRAELKVPLSDFLKETDGRKPEGLVVEEGGVSIEKTLDKRIKKLLRSRLSEAVQQGETIFFDCSEMPLFGTLVLGSGVNEQIPEIIKNRVILYQTTHYTPNVKITHRNERGEETSFTPVAPDLDYFFGIYKETDELGGFL